MSNDGLREGQRRFIGGTKGSHLILDHPELLEATRESEIFFENDDGRIVLILPFFNRVMIGTTDIRIDRPDEAVINEAEIDYLLAMVDKVFPTIAVDRSQIVFTFSGVRPLPYSDGGATGQISRDHSIRTIPPSGERGYSIHSLIGGKWTTFRAFAEQVTDLVLSDLGRSRRTSTANVSIGGGRAYPRSEEARAAWLENLQMTSELSLERLHELFERYGTRSEDFAAYMSNENDCPLANHAGYSQREVEYILKCEKVERLDDLLLRRSLIAMLGELTRELLFELAEHCAETLGWSADRKALEIARALDILRVKHRVEL